MEVVARVAGTAVSGLLWVASRAAGVQQRLDAAVSCMEPWRVLDIVMSSCEP